MTIFRKLAGSLAESSLMSTGKRHWLANLADPVQPLSKKQKLLSGVYLILRDYADGIFPPTFEDQRKAYEAEIAYTPSIGSTEELRVWHYMTKPFWNPQSIDYYLSHFIQTSLGLQRVGIAPPQRLLELGCGTGWMAEWLAIEGYDVVGTTLAPSDVEMARTRLEGLRLRGLNVKLRFESFPMESVDEIINTAPQFDAVLIYEALHHAYDWRRTLEAAFRCLKPGGWFFILHEPNILHTMVSYRAAKLGKTHEIGFSRPAVLRHLKRAGFGRIVFLKKRLNLIVTPLWIAAQRPA